MIRIEKLTKSFGEGEHATVVLDRLDFGVASREIYAVVGASGAGKSTLATCVNLLERPTSGSIVVNGENLSDLNEAQLRIARRRIGTIFQSDGLFSRRTAFDNVALPLEYLGVTRADVRRRVAELLDRVHLGDLARRYPHELSGGQRQRVGIARALVLRPSVLLSDEATSGLDPESTASVVRLLKELRDDLDLSILFITHEMDTVLQVADSVAKLDRGHIVESGRLVDLVRDAGSELGQALRPRRDFAEPDAGQAVWFVSYSTADVPLQWVSQLSTRLGSEVALLGASIESINGVTVGHATIGIAGKSTSAVSSALAGLGLQGHPAPVAASSLEDVA